MDSGDFNSVVDLYAQAANAVRARRAAEKAAAAVEAANKSGTTKLSHAQGEVYRRLFEQEPTIMHTAEADVQTLQAIVTHPFVWGAIVNRTSSAVHWRLLVQHANELYSDHLHSVRGWRLEHRPKCVHGPMRAADAVEDSSVEGGWRVDFDCVVYCTDGLCAPQQRGTHPDYDPSTASGKKRKTSKRKTKLKPGEVSGASLKNGEPGACTCTGACKRNCPCRDIGHSCGANCVHSKAKNPRGSVKPKCQNGTTGDAPVSDDDVPGRSAPASSSSEALSKRIRAVKRKQPEPTTEPDVVDVGDATLTEAAHQRPQKVARGGAGGRGRVVADTSSDDDDWLECDDDVVPVADDKHACSDSSDSEDNMAYGSDFSCVPDESDDDSGQNGDDEEEVDRIEDDEDWDA